MQNEIIEKLQKILALASGNGATQGEMEAAMARAKEIALKHGIELASIPAREDSKVRTAVNIETHKDLKTSTRYVHPYHVWVLRTLEDAFGVRFIYWKTRIGSHPYWSRIYVLGEATDVTLAVGLFPWLESLFPSLYHKAWKAGKVSKDFAAQNGFYAGLCMGIQEANKREEAKLSAEDRSKWALVVQDKNALVQAEYDKYFVQPDGKEPKARKQRQREYDYDAMAHGKEQGKNIRLNQLNGAANTNLVA